MINLKNKNIVVTGAAIGIGKACVEGLAARGANVVVNDLTQNGAEAVAAVIRRAGGKAVAHAADISDWSQAEGLIQRCVDEFGSIEGLVNNAALFGMAMVEDITEADMRRFWAVNVGGTVACSQFALRRMMAAGGSIVNTVSGAQAGIVGMGVYGATKGAVASFTYAAAIELAETSVRINAVSPRAATKMLTDNYDFHRARGVEVKPRDLRPPSVNVPVYEYLLSDASVGVNGQVVRIDGDALCLCSHPHMMEPVLRKDVWTAELVAEAFQETLSKTQAKLGI